MLELVFTCFLELEGRICNSGLGCIVAYLNLVDPNGSCASGPWSEPGLLLFPALGYVLISYRREASKP